MLEYIFRKTTTKRCETGKHFDDKSIQTSRPMRVVVMLRPPTTIQPFLEQFATYVTKIVFTQQGIPIVGDFNIHRELSCAPGVKLMNETLVENNLQQQVAEATHIRGYMLNLIVIRSPSSIVLSTAAYPSMFSMYLLPT